MKPWFPKCFGAVTALLFAATAFGQVVPPPPPAPSLSITGMSVSPSSAKPGDVVTVTVNVSNTATANFDGTADFSAEFTHLVTGHMFRLPATGTSTASPTGGFIPAATVDPTTNANTPGVGTFTFTGVVPLATTQSGGYRATVAMTNATYAGGTQAGPVSFSVTTAVLTITGTPDFQITSLTYPAGISYKGGDVIPMTLTFRNRRFSDGTPNVPFHPALFSPIFRIELILSTNPTFGDADDFLLTFHDVSAVIDADDANRTITWNQLLPGNYAGSYYVLAKIDTLEAVPETSSDTDFVNNGNNVWYDVNATRIALQPTSFPTIYLASLTSTGGSAGGYSDNPSVSADGRYTAFVSDATNLGTGDSNNARDVFLFDNQTSLVRRINVSQQGAPANAGSANPAISGDGRYVAFASDATNLVFGDTNGFTDIFVVDTITGALTRESVGQGGGQANGSSFRPVISADGRYVVFESNATNFSALATTGVTQIYLRDRTSGTTALVSQSGGVAGNGVSLQAAISADGRYIAFASDASNLVAGDSNSARDIFLRDVTAGTTTRVSVATGGGQADGHSRAPSINRNPGNASDGRYIAFGSEAANLVAGDTNAVSDVFVHDRVTGGTTRVSVSSSGGQGTDPTDPTITGSHLGSINPSISATGRYVAFASLANNLTPGDAAGRFSAADNNNALDIFVADRDVSGSGTFDTAGNIATTLVSVNRFGYQTLRVLGVPSTAASDIYPVISGDGRWVAFPSDAEGAPGLAHGATNRLSPDNNRFRDIFLHDRRINALPNPSVLPTIAISSPVTGAAFPINVPVNLVANASAPIGTVASVQFFANGTSIGVDSTFPYTIAWSPPAVGTFALSALVTDSFGNQAISNNVNVTIVAVSPALPVVQITAPNQNATLPINVETTISANATDPDGTIARVDFLVNGIVIGSDLVFPYSVIFKPTASGAYRLTAVATDDGGNQTTSSQINFTVGAGVPPTVSITSPAANTSVVTGTQVTIVAAASDPDGTVVAVRFLVNGGEVGSASSAPFSTTFTPSAPGTYSITAQAEDNSGNVTTSAAVTLAVVANQLPTVAITSPMTGITVRVGTMTTLTATAADPDGTISSVQFFANGIPIGGPDTAAPYTVDWQPAAEGIHRITAVATDSGGGTATSSEIHVLVLSLTLVGDTVYVGNYQGTNETGRFALINLRGRAASMIAFSTSTPSRIYTFPSLPVDASGNFTVSDATGRVVVSGMVNNTGVSGTIDGGRLTFIGIVTPSAGTVTPRYYTGSITDRPASTLNAIVGGDGSITIHAADGTFQAAGAGIIDATGAFNVTTPAGIRITGRADPTSGFLTGTLTGGPGGTFTAAVTSGQPFSDGFLRNLSTRGQVSTGTNFLIAGFVVGGTNPKQVLIRAIGPSLSAFGITGAIPDPQLAVFGGNAQIASNDNWGGSAAVQSAALRAGAFPLQASSRDAAVLLTLQPGNYTAQVSGVSGATGVALVEFYDMDNLVPFSAHKVTNLSTRGLVGTGQAQLIAGFVVTGNASKQLLIRGVGPALAAAPFSLPGTLVDPVLRLVRADNVLIRENDNWELGNDVLLVTDATTRVGAFALARGSRDAVILISLPPGVYTAQLTGAGTSTGTGLIELYEVP